MPICKFCTIGICRNGSDCNFGHLPWARLIDDESLSSSDEFVYCGSLETPPYSDYDEVDEMEDRFHESSNNNKKEARLITKKLNNKEEKTNNIYSGRRKIDKNKKNKYNNKIKRSLNKIIFQ